MTRFTVQAGKRRQLLKRLILLAAIVVLIGLVSFLRSPRVGAILEALEAPGLPSAPEFQSRVWLTAEQNWSVQMRRRFHHASQGVKTLPVPLSWFMAMEQPASNIFTVPFGNRGLFSEDDYLLRFGFIEGEVSEHNPLKLPVGFATTESQNLPGINGSVTALGFTCAACHTGHLKHGNTEYIVEGGPATTDLGQLTTAIGAALGQTLVSARVPLMKARFNRFAEKVLGPDAYNSTNVAQLESELESLVNYLASEPGKVDVVEGYSRLDALNRIGNQVFAIDAGRRDNYVAINAPVNYPHIWTASWFSWVQYDASIMSPLVRNAGEALGVAAGFDLTAPDGERRFSSSVDINELWWIENSLSGESPDPDSPQAGLLSPPWPETFPEIDRERASRGQEIYERICVDCHLPPLSSQEIWQPEYFSPVSYYVDGQLRQTPESLLQLKLINLQQVGTDSAQSDVLNNRTVNTAGYAGGDLNSNTSGMGINAEVCAHRPEFPDSPYAERNYSRVQPGPLVNVEVSDAPMLNFGLALGAIVQQTIDSWYGLNYVPEENRRRYEEDRPNCLRGSNGYKARPLNGVWATAPFLHNGSIATVKDLLSPPELRPEFVVLGNIEFDPVNLGLMQDSQLLEDNTAVYSKEGYFVLNTNTPGNHNTGHEFSSEWDESLHWSEQRKGVIGPEFTGEEVLDIIEYLKTL